MDWIFLAAFMSQDASATPTAPVPMPIYEHREALATFRYDAMKLADDCEIEARNRRLETDVCERWQTAAVGYMRQTADLYVWCKGKIEEGNFERTIPLDCPIQGDTNLDPVITRYNEVGSLFGLPLARF